MMFYLLSLITGMLECGWIAYGAVTSLPLWQILCYPLAYHIGNLFPQPFSLGKRSLYIFGGAALICGAATISANRTVCTVLTCLSLFLNSAVIQSVRSGLKSDGNRLVKRIFRVGGFALAPLAAAAPYAVLITSSVIALCGLKSYNGQRKVVKASSKNGFSAVMLFHQLHYFFYAHITLATVSTAFFQSDPVWGVIAAALLFCGTWVTYMSVEPLVSKTPAKELAVFYVGHLGISALLFVMSFVKLNPLFIALWIITGFGGGVVYTISARAKKDGCFDKISMNVSENIGHTLGLVIAVMIAALAGAYSPRIMLVFGSASALLAVVSMTFTIKKGRNL